MLSWTTIAVRGSRRRCATGSRTAPPGARLPSTRALVARHRASPVTVQQALRDADRPGPGREPARRRHLRPRRPDGATRRLRLADRGPALAAGTHRRPSPPRCAASRTTSSPSTPATPTGSSCRSGSCARRSPERSAATPPSPGRRSAGLPELQSWFAARARRGAPGRHHPPTPGDVIVAARQPERAELGVPRAGRRRAAAAHGVPDVLGRHRRRGPGRRPRRPRALRPGGPGPGRARPRLRGDRRPRCSTPSRPTRTPPARSGRTSCAEQVLDVVREPRRVPRRGRLGPRLRHHHDAARRSPRTTTPATSSTCARSPRACRRPCASPRSSPAARRGNGSWPTAPPSRCTSAACSRRPRSTSSPSPPGRRTCAACGSSCGRAATCSSSSLRRARPDGAPRPGARRAA